MQDQTGSLCPLEGARSDPESWMPSPRLWKSFASCDAVVKKSLTELLCKVADGDNSVSNLLSDVERRAGKNDLTVNKSQGPLKHSLWGRDYQVEEPFKPACDPQEEPEAQEWRTFLKRPEQTTNALMTGRLTVHADTLRVLKALKENFVLQGWIGKLLPIHWQR